MCVVVEYRAGGLVTMSGTEPRCMRVIANGTCFRIGDYGINKSRIAKFSSVWCPTHNYMSMSVHSKDGVLSECSHATCVYLSQ